MLIKKLTAIAALSGFALVTSPVAADDSAELKEMLLKQQKQIEMLQKKVEKQETVHNEALTHYIRNEVDRALENRQQSLLTLSSHVEGLTIKGDLRVRYEDTEFTNGTSRDRFRQRFRLGFLWKTNEGWEIGAGFATGGNDATSTNDTYSDGSDFETGDLRIDYAYAKHKFDNGTSVTLGQHKNPYLNSGLIFDSDARFVGASVHYDSQDSGLFATAGAYVVHSHLTAGGENDDAELLAAQVGMEVDGLTAALGYFHFDSATSTTNLGLDKNYDINIVHSYFEYAGKTDMFKYKVFGEFAVNIGAEDDSTQNTLVEDSENEDTVWALGGEIGIDKWKFKYMYAVVEADAAYNPLTSSDFGAANSSRNGGSANTKGHMLGLGYKVTKNFEIAMTYHNVEAIKDAGGDEKGELFQLDFKYKF